MTTDHPPAPIRIPDYSADRDDDSAARPSRCLHCITSPSLPPRALLSQKIEPFRLLTSILRNGVRPRLSAAASDGHSFRGRRNRQKIRVAWSFAQRPAAVVCSSLAPYRHHRRHCPFRDLPSLNLHHLSPTSLFSLHPLRTLHLLCTLDNRPARPLSYQRPPNPRLAICP